MATSLLASPKNSRVYADPHDRAHDRARDRDRDRDHDRDRDCVHDHDSCRYAYDFDYSQIGRQIMLLNLEQP